MRTFFLVSIAALSLAFAGCGGGQTHPEAAASAHGEGAACEHCKHKEGGEACEHCKHKEGGEHGEHGGGHGEHGGEHGSEHGIPAGPVRDLHAAFAPIWHGSEGAARVAKMCEQIAPLKTQAGAAAAAAEPSSKSAAETLVREFEALGVACAAPGQAGAEAQLTTVHEAFHKLIDASGAKH